MTCFIDQQETRKKISAKLHAYAYKNNTLGFAVLFYDRRVSILAQRSARYTRKNSLSDAHHIITCHLTSFSFRLKTFLCYLFSISFISLIINLVSNIHITPTCNAKWIISLFFCDKKLNKNKNKNIISFSFKKN